MPGSARERLGLVFLCILLAVGVPIALIGKHATQEEQITRWAADRGFTLAGTPQHPGFLEPTPFWLTGKHDDVLKVELEDADHHRRTAWFRFRLLGMDQAWKD